MIINNPEGCVCGFNAMIVDSLQFCDVSEHMSTQLSEIINELAKKLVHPSKSCEILNNDDEYDDEECEEEIDLLEGEEVSSIYITPNGEIVLSTEDDDWSVSDVMLTDEHAQAVRPIIIKMVQKQHERLSRFLKSNQ